MGMHREANVEAVCRTRLSRYQRVAAGGLRLDPEVCRRFLCGWPAQDSQRRAAAPAPAKHRGTGRIGAASEHAVRNHCQFLSRHWAGYRSTYDPLELQRQQWRGH